MTTNRTPYDPHRVTCCRQCSAPLSGDSQWCSAECEKAWRWAAQADTDEARGVIVGGQDHGYEFWPYAEHAHLANWNVIAWGCFASDDEAIAWFKTNHPEWFARGVEMRVS